MNRKLLSKENFPVFKEFPELAYLDNSATQQKPFQVMEAVENYYRRENANPLRGLYGLSVAATDAYEGARSAVRQFINAADDAEIIFTRNASESLNLVAYSYGRTFIHEGDEVLVAVTEHHSDFLPWQLLAKEVGARFRILDCGEEGELTPEMLKAALTPETKLFAVTQVSNVLGRVNPIKEFARLCHENGTLIVCDGAQSVPHMPVEVRDLDVDFLAFSGHKMLAPMGIGVLYGKRGLLEKMPPFLSGGEMIEYVTREGATYAELPHKFEAGTVNVGGAVGLRAAIDYINDLGFDALESRERELTELCFHEMQKVPHVYIVGSSRPEDHCGILTFTVDGVHPHDVAAIMDSMNVAVRAGHHCAQPLHGGLAQTEAGVRYFPPERFPQGAERIRSTTRMSLAFYNTEEDVMKFIAALKQLRGVMGYAE